MPKSHDKPKTLEAQMEPSNREEQEPTDRSPVRQDDEPAPEEASSNVERVQSDDWWSASAISPEWSESETERSATEVTRSKEAGTADVYFCGRTNLFPLIRAIQAIAKENLTGLLRSFWDEEPIDLLARDAEIVLVTTRDPALYCPETPELLTNVDVVLVDRARDQQSESGIPFLLTLAREEAIDREPALELMKQCGQKLFAQLWTAPGAWIMFEKNSELLSDFEEVSGEPDVEDWALETLRLVQNPEPTEKFDPSSIPAFTKEGFERVQKLKLSSDEAQFASQFNGARSVQQIAKNLRLDLKSARQLLFRFVALEIVECWPGSTAAKPRNQSLFGRLGRLVRRDR